MPDNSRPSSISSAPWLIVFGICLTAAGVLSYFQLERHSLYASTRDFRVFLSGARMVTGVVAGNGYNVDRKRSLGLASGFVKSACMDLEP